MTMKPSVSAEGWTDTDGWTFACWITDCSVGKFWYDCGKPVRAGGGYGGRPKVFFSDVDVLVDGIAFGSRSQDDETSGKRGSPEGCPLEEGVFIYPLAEIDGLGGIEFCPPENDDPACPR